MFHKCESPTQIKDLFRKLAKRLHPDHGGSDSLMILLQDAKQDADLRLELISSMDDHQEKSSKKKKPKWKSSGRYSVEDDADLIYSDDSRVEILDDILLFAKHHKSFDASFTESIYEYLEDRGYITSPQYNALVRIYYGRKINKWNKYETK